MENLARSVGVPILYGCEIAVVGKGRVEAFYNNGATTGPDVGGMTKDTSGRPNR